MDALPSELVTAISLFLSHHDLKAFRLCCKAYAALAESALFDNFEFRLWPRRERFAELEALTNAPTIASKLKVLSFESGVPLEYADYRYWQAQVYKALSSNWAQSHSGHAPPEGEYRKFHAALQSRFTENVRWDYALYRQYLDVESDRVANSLDAMLARSLSLLSQYCSNIQFKLLMREPQISLEEVEHFVPECDIYQCPETQDPRQQVLDRRRNTLAHFLKFLSATQQSPFDLANLTMSSIPFQLIDQPDALVTLKDAFSSLTSLSLDLSALPHSDWLSRAGLTEPYSRGRSTSARQLRQLLDQPQNLQCLRLELPRGKEAEFSFELFDRTNLDRFPRHFLSNLTHLSLSRFRCSWPDMQLFLQEATNLQTVVLVDGRLETASLIDLLWFMPTLKLGRVSLGGKWYVDEDEGQWHANSKDDFTDCIAATVYEGPYVQRGMKHRIEEFLVNGGNDCPLPRWTPQGREEELWELYGDTSWHYLPAMGE
ncbi:uncharacterized protein HMPREF1541_10203 [Cyphellophora europaea CBS 101466]|uniref:F-box domain-containing protein n=1 Tax=Cyphellophora europaea (strain CBS 101466) TaxID=1220924 RepID=W2S929_CYPE1|nr:uncharacterized protein HMPREF1541_10203 [Cyphellophora europaea CBS 101466]ETN44533.1 hypothetical protein HMPREF1541_10203 [Cyphellophora europaea CBS 101466]